MRGYGVANVQGIVSPVKNQGKCGSCWTFSTTGTLILIIWKSASSSSRWVHQLTGAAGSSVAPGALEAAHALVFGEVVSLSEQQLVDCAGAFETFGCNGGLPSHAFEYVRY